MKTKDPALEQYRRQLNEWVSALAVQDNESVYGDAAEPYTGTDVDLFTEGNLAKRAEILDLQLTFIKPAFEDFDDLLDEYITTQPLAAFNAGPGDAAAMLHWMRDSFDLTPEQDDHVSFRLARFDVEEAARADRKAHVRFQERLSVAGRLANQLGENDRLRIHLNPARGWSKLHTREFLDEQTELPGSVVFFAVKTEIRSAVLDEPVPSLLEMLQGERGLTLGEWAERAGFTEPQELVPLTRRLAELGLVAFS